MSQASADALFRSLAANGKAHRLACLPCSVPASIRVRRRIARIARGLQGRSPGSDQQAVNHGIARETAATRKRIIRRERARRIRLNQTVGCRTGRLRKYTNDVARRCSGGIYVTLRHPGPRLKTRSANLSHEKKPQRIKPVGLWQFLKAVSNPARLYSRRGNAVTDR